MTNNYVEAGLVFAEDFNSLADLVKKGATIFGTPKIETTKNFSFDEVKKLYITTKNRYL